MGPFTKDFLQGTNHIHVRDSRSPCLTEMLSHFQELFNAFLIHIFSLLVLIPPITLDASSMFTL